MLECFFFVLVQVQSFENTGIAFDEFGCGKALRDTGFLCMIFNKDHDAVKASVDRTALVVFVTEIQSSGAFLVFSDMKGMVDQLMDTFILGRRDRYDRNPEFMLHLVNEDGSAVAPDFVHHVQGEYHRDIELHQLHGQIEISFDIGGIYDIDDAAGLFVQDKLAGDDLLGSIRGHAVDAGKIRDLSFRMFLDGAAFPIDGNAREVSDVLVGSRELVKECSLTGILVSCEREGELRTVRKGIFICFYVIAAAFTETRVVNDDTALFFLFLLFGSF